MRRAEGCRPYRVPTSYAARLGDAGFTVVSLANDHAYDFGEPGLRQTVDALSAAGVGHTGRRGQVSVQPVGSVDVAMVGFAPTDWSASVTDIAEAKRLVRRAARTADVVVVAMHGGAEGAGAQHVGLGNERHLGRDRGDVVDSRTRSSTPALIWSWATAPASSAGWSGTRAG